MGIPDIFILDKPSLLKDIKYDRTSNLARVPFYHILAFMLDSNTENLPLLNPEAVRSWKNTLDGSYNVPIAAVNFIVNFLLIQSKLQQKKLLFDSKEWRSKRVLIDYSNNNNNNTNCRISVN